MQLINLYHKLDKTVFKKNASYKIRGKCFVDYNLSLDSLK